MNGYELLLVLAGFPTGIALYLAVLATKPVMHDRGTTIAIKAMQLAIVWLFPVAGPLFVLHVANEIAPASVRLDAIPPPFRRFVA